MNKTNTDCGDLYEHPNERFFNIHTRGYAGCMSTKERRRIGFDVILVFRRWKTKPRFHVYLNLNVFVGSEMEFC